MTDTQTRQNVKPGDVLAEKYRVERVLGQGGMGVVVLAEHIELRERVAIKFLLDEDTDSPELAERFMREARAAVRIKSEHVVRVIDVSRLPSGSPYMVMEYLEGEDLAQRLLSGPVAIEDAVDYVIQCCEAMQVAHRSGIVHRDLKPANLFLTQRPDGSPLIKVLDFGISKVKSTDAAQLSLTHTQAMMGSPLYMSPEQMRSSKDVSASADIWSLGVILHELIAGDVPFIAATFPEVLVQVMSAEPPRLRTLRADVPEGLEAVVLRCLQKDPGDRFASVAGLGVALSPYASPRTLSLQARLKSSLSQPPPALVPAQRLDVPRTADAPPVPLAPPPVAAESAVADVLPTRTNTAWAGQSSNEERAVASRRRRYVAVALGAFVLAGVGVAVSLGSREPPKVVPPAASPAAALPAQQRLPEPVTAPHPAPAPKVAPANDPAAAPEAAAEPSAAAARPAPKETRATQQHSGAPAEVNPAAGASLRSTSRTSAHRGVSAKAGVGARTGTGTARPPRSAAEPAAAPAAPKAASAKARSKPLSIEFK
jgi:eukaryotic-like serine/threonine-protein kinase